ncbi:MAG TPA: phage tail sheath C-terminal domain-containing protein, partial [Chitinispirillaceae bacterium]|nr:phage tail sheath C-terminal domain-containing protein [Chitinispirillaceae bacterium]
ASKRYHLYAIGWATLTAAQLLSDHLEEVSNEINQRGARGYMFISSALADSTTISAVNARRLQLGYIRKCRRPGYENAAAFAAMQAAQETPWRSLNNTELVGCDSPDPQDWLSFNEVNNLLWSGVSPFEVGTGGRVRAVRAISTYTENAAGSPNTTYLDSFKIATADYVREAIVDSHKRNFANSVLRDNHVEGEPEYVVTPADIRSNNLAVCKRIEIEGGLNDVEKYKDLFTADRDPNVPGRVNCSVPIDIVDSAHIFATEIKIVSSF